VAEDTWFSRDLPVLDAAVHLVDAAAFAHPSAHELAERTGLELDQVLTALRALEQAGLIAVTFTMGGGRNSHVDAISGEARQLVGAWPSAGAIASRLVAELERRADAASSDEERSKWRRLLDSVLGLGREVVVDVAAAAITRQVPGA
jgi:DNA-binding MarR family transcriptional regulator